MLTALSVRYCKIWCDSENFHTNRNLRMKLCQLAFSLHSLSVTFVTSTCFLSLSNCDTALAANSVSLKDIISGYAWLYNFKQASALQFRRHQLAVSFLLCSWTCSSSFCVITVSKVQLHNVQFVQYLYSKCAVLLCSWTCSSSFCVITVSRVQLQTVQSVHYLYRNYFEQ